MSDSEVKTQTREEKDVIIELVSKLFGEEVSKLFQGEEITSYAAIADLLKRDADAAIFRNLGLKYGSAVRFKTEFSKSVPVREINSTPRLKPTMGELSGFDPEMKRLYLSRRKRVGLLATEHWGAGNSPKFNTPDKKAELKKFASDIEPECAILEIGFTCEAICQHIQDFFNEQRRYKKRIGKLDDQVSEDTSAAESSKPVHVQLHAKRRMSGKPPSCGKKFRASLDETPLEQDAATTSSDSGESLSTLSVESDSDPDCNKKDSGTAEEDKCIKVPTTMSSSQVVIKAIFSKLLDRGEIVSILKSKFMVKQSNLTNLTPSQLMQVLIKKLIKNNYVTLKGNVNSLQKSDVTVHKEIEI